MAKKEDLRVRKTKKNLYEGLLYLMKDKSFEELKVSDICETSLTNRSTFYDHFNDKYELLAALIKDPETELVKKLEENHNLTPKDYYMKMIALLFDHIEENQSIYTAVIKKNNNSVAMDMLFDTLLKDVKEHIEKNNSYRGTIPVDIITIFYVSAVIHVCAAYIQEPTKYQKEEILASLAELVPNDIY